MVSPLPRVLRSTAPTPDDKIREPIHLIKSMKHDTKVRTSETYQIVLHIKCSSPELHPSELGATCSWRTWFVARSRGGAMSCLEKLYFYVCFSESSVPGGDSACRRFAPSCYAC